jgi:hypothetical protein
MFGADLQTLDITAGIEHEYIWHLPELVVGRGCIWYESSWKQLGFRQKKFYHHPPSRNIDEVERNVQHARQQSADMSDQYSEIHLSMRQRCMAVIRARSGHMVY